MSVASTSQNIFEPGTIMVEYVLSSNTKVCKICESVNGTAQWSRNSQSVLCDAKKAFSSHNIVKTSTKFCKLNETLERKGFILQHVISWNVKFYLTNDPIPESSMAVYVNEN